MKLNRLRLRLRLLTLTKTIKSSERLWLKRNHGWNVNMSNVKCTNVIMKISICILYYYTTQYNINACDIRSFNLQKYPWIHLPCSDDIYISVNAAYSPLCSLARSLLRLALLGDSFELRLGGRRFVPSLAAVFLLLGGGRCWRLNWPAAVVRTLLTLRKFF